MFEGNAQEECSAPADVGGTKPVLRWAGGKYSMAQNLVRLLPRYWSRYVEPMAGGAALFFFIQPRKAVLADVNSDLMTFYSVLQARPRALIKQLSLLRASREVYYALRNAKPRTALQCAVRFAYLNRLAWNGLYRVNRRGEFNVPIGDRLPPVMWEFGALEVGSKILQRAHLVTADFRETAASVKRGDFVFFDPPYPKGSRDGVGFNRYAKDFFTESHHRDLVQVITYLTSRQIPVMLTLGDCSVFERLYPRRMRRTRIQSKALIACHGRARREVSELILTNY